MMTVTSPAFAPPDSPALVAGELIDALIEAVVLPPDGRARAAVISCVVQEMCAAVQWLHSPDISLGGGEATEDELAGLRQLATAAREHQHCLTLEWSRCVPPGRLPNGVHSPGRGPAATQRRV
jgi:hypothetical protein